MLQVRRVGQLLVKWDDGMPFGTPFVTVCKRGIILDMSIKEFDFPNKTLEENIQMAIKWATEYQLN